METVRAVGAEALKESILKQAEEGWFKCSGFKLHLHPNLKGSAVKVQAANFPPLPSGKDIVTVFSDFFNSIEDSIEFILSHPNGWEGRNQANMRWATILAGLVPNEIASKEHVHFVTEGKASLHFCIHHGLSSFLKNQEAIIIIDAGGGTVDISTYTCVSAKDDTQAQTFKEATAPQCNNVFCQCLYLSSTHEQSFSISIFWLTYFKVKLKRTKFAKEAEHIAHCFDKTMKLWLKVADKPAYIRFSGMRDKDPKLNINMGKLKLTGAEVASFFEPSVLSIIKVIDKQQLASKSTVSVAFLVGGFAASNYLFSKLQEHFKPLNITFSCPNSHVNKATTDDTLSFHLDQAILECISKYNYGIRTFTPYDASVPGHVEQKDKTFMSDDGVHT
ncbi:hypothetical protein IW262DRAFT_1468852 [Armillaria fumosa]|nr:hypothetical protein IW262DRAFT_1468852 [Armillaria fumosa]